MAGHFHHLKKYQDTAYIFHRIDAKILRPNPPLLHPVTLTHTKIRPQRLYMLHGFYDFCMEQSLLATPKTAQIPLFLLGAVQTTL